MIDGKEIKVSRKLPEKEKKTEEKKEETFESPEKFYQKYCQITVPIGKKYGVEMSIEDCIQQGVSSEKQLFQACLEEEKSEKECQEVIVNYRELTKKVTTKSGCQSFWKGLCSVIPEETARKNCQEEMARVCQSLPE